MAKRYQLIISVTAVLGLMFLFMACGGSSGGGSVTYSGSTDPAVADSTTATTLAEYGMGAVEAGFPVASPFLAPPPGPVPGALSAQPLAPNFNTTVTIPVPSGAVYDGSDYDSTYGTGTADINGSMLLYLNNTISATADTWNVIDGELDGSIVFNDFRAGEGPDISGTVTVPYATFEFSGDASFLMSTMEIIDDPGFPVWAELDITFTNITVSDEGESWSLGEGEWNMEISPGISVNLDIYSQSVKYEGSTYKLEDTRLYVEFGEYIPLAIPTVYTTDITISGIDYKAGTFYHPELGVLEFGGIIHEEDPPGDITNGSLTFYNTSGLTLYSIFFGYDDSVNTYAPATYYNLNMSVDAYTERGYYIDGTFIPSDLAPIIPD